MRIEFKTEAIEAFVLYRKATDRQYKRYLSDRQLSRDLDKVIRVLEQVPDCDALLKSYKSLHFERLKHDLRGLCSVRLGFKARYRLMFIEEEGGIVISLIEITEHYGDK